MCELENNPQFVLEVNRVTDIRISLIQVGIAAGIYDPSELSSGVTN